MALADLKLHHARPEKRTRAMLSATRCIRKDRRTKHLVRRLRPGDIALLHHADLDTTAARALIDAQVSAVVNAAPSITGRYPNRGPSLLLESGIPLLDSIGEAAFEQIKEGESGWLEGGSLYLTKGSCFPGTLLTPALLEAQLEAARDNLGVELDYFARNTLEFLNHEKGMLFDPVEAPKLRTRFADRHVLIVVRGEGYKEDLAALSRDYINDFRPVLLAVDGGADALLEFRLRPDVILGDMDSVSDDALKCGAELVVHGYTKGDERGAPGLKRVERLGLQASVFSAPGTSEDVAMLLADALGARLIVAVGTHFSLEEFLDKGRRGMASTFLTRLRIGPKLVDAKGVARLQSGRRFPWSALALLVLAPATTIGAVFLLSPMGRNMLRTLNVWFGLHFR
jgi:uncharacterized membrane-anchored protein